MPHPIILGRNDQDSSDTTIYLLAFPQMVCATTRPVIVDLSKVVQEWE